MKRKKPATKSSKSTCVCVNVLPTMGGMEFLQYDLVSQAFVRTDFLALPFDATSREPLTGPDELRMAIKQLYERNAVTLNTPTTLVLPSYFTRQDAVPEDLLGEDLTPFLISEAEQLYMFKKLEPAIGYTMLGMQVLYTAYPKIALETLQQAFQTLKIPMVAIDCSYTAGLRGLITMGVAQDEVNNQLKWGVLMMSDTTLFMAVLDGVGIEKASETPLPVKNTQDELLAEIKEDFTEFFGFEILSRLALINNTTAFEGQVVLNQMQFYGPTDIFDQNEHTLSTLGGKAGTYPCSLEAVGGAMSRYVPEVPVLNLGDPDQLEGIYRDQRKRTVALTLIGVGVLLFVLQWGVGLLLGWWQQDVLNKGKILQAEGATIQAALSKMTDARERLYVRRGTVYNQRLNNLLIQISQNLPSDAWLESVELKANDHLDGFNLKIQGGALNADRLNPYIKTLNKELGTSPARPTVVPDQKEDRRYFKYTFTNAPGLKGLTP